MKMGEIEPVVDILGPSCLRQGALLVKADRVHHRVGINIEGRGKRRQVEALVHRCHYQCVDEAGEGEGKEVDVRVDDIERVRTCEDRADLLSYRAARTPQCLVPTATTLVCKAIAQSSLMRIQTTKRAGNQ